MKFFPTQERDHKIKLCVCGKSAENISINKNKYQKTTGFIILGLICFIVGVVALVSSLFDGTTYSGWLWFELLVTTLLVVFLARSVTKYTQKGHNMFCAMRRTMIDIAK